jgi:D-alanyl-D-alanine carboxypeptidase
LLFLTLLMVLVAAAEDGHGRPGMLAFAYAAAPPQDIRLQSLLYSAVREGLPGVSLRVEGPGIDFQGAAGVADLVTGEPLTTDHVMYVASLGKTFTATVALQLCSEGRLDLYAPITTWLPQEVTRRIPSSEKITLRHLLSHTSGLMDYLNDDTDWRSDFARDPHRRWDHSDVIPYLFDKPLLFEPGTRYHYSNSNYILVGRILEQVTGQPFHRLIRTRILMPLGLQHTFNGSETVRGKRAHGYIARGGRIIDTYPWYSHYGLADSGIHSTPGDLALFLRSLFTTGKILSKTMLTEMTDVPESVGPSSRYGMGIFVQRDPRGTGSWYTHDGIDPGYRADMMYLPGRNLTVVLSANASLGKADVIYDKLITAVLQTALDAARKTADRHNIGGSGHVVNLPTAH